MSRASSIVALALAVPILAADAALDRLHAALACVQFLGLRRRALGLVPRSRHMPVMRIELLPRLLLTIVLVLGLQQLARVGQRLFRADLATRDLLRRGLAGRSSGQTSSSPRSWRPSSSPISSRPSSPPSWSLPSSPRPSSPRPSSPRLSWRRPSSLRLPGYGLLRCGFLGDSLGNFPPRYFLCSGLFGYDLPGHFPGHGLLGHFLRYLAGPLSSRLSSRFSSRLSSWPSWRSSSFAPSWLQLSSQGSCRHGGHEWPWRLLYQ